MGSTEPNRCVWNKGGMDAKRDASYCIESFMTHVYMYIIHIYIYICVYVCVCVCVCFIFTNVNKNFDKTCRERRSRVLGSFEYLQ